MQEYREQQVKDVSFRGRNAILILRKRRYICPRCRKKFNEQIDWLPKYARKTMRLTETIIRKLENLVTYSYVAKECNESVNTVQRIFDVVSYSPKKLPKVLLIDEFKGNAANKKYRCILNSIEYGYTNGRIEGMNNKIKVLKRVSFGIRNFDSFRSGIIHTA